jgi:hypothetical protein
MHPGELDVTVFGYSTLSVTGVRLMPYASYDLSSSIQLPGSSLQERMCWREFTLLPISDEKSEVAKWPKL